MVILQVCNEHLIQNTLAIGATVQVEITSPSWTMVGWLELTKPVWVIQESRWNGITALFREGHHQVLEARTLLLSTIRATEPAEIPMSSWTTEASDQSMRSITKSQMLSLPIAWEISQRARWSISRVRKIKLILQLISTGRASRHGQLGKSTPSSRRTWPRDSPVVQTRQEWNMTKTALLVDPPLKLSIALKCNMTCSDELKTNSSPFKTQSILDWKVTASTMESRSQKFILQPDSPNHRSTLKTKRSLTATKKREVLVTE